MKANGNIDVWFKLFVSLNISFFAYGFYDKQNGKFKRKEYIRVNEFRWLNNKKIQK